MPEPDADLLAERYGAPRRTGRILVAVVVGAIVLAGLAWVGWAAWFHSSPDIRAEVASYDVLDAHEVRARVDLRLGDDDVTGTCLLRATALDHTIVGERNVKVQELGPGASWVSIRTERLATSVTVARCAAD